ncbi:MAG: 4'-phosphopantetheinyl transferase superfamily protein [Verrucomicrobiota bacterium]|nr:4'-phosphopantetheinyl transferase superfamily protein [Verrucomicrobiota bacterium]
MLGTLLNNLPRDIAFTYGEYGKPRVHVTESDPPLNFSISHSSDLAIFAVATEAEVGVDLEDAGQLPEDDENLLALAAGVLSAGELKAWRELPEAQARRSAFLRAWTRKEALLKANGRGVSQSMAEVELPIGSAHALAAFTVASLGVTWEIYDLAAPPTFFSALAVERQI